MKIPLLTFARHKFVYVLLTAFILAVVNRDFVMTYFFFDIHAPDLAKFDGQAIKNDLLKCIRFSYSPVQSRFLSIIYYSNHHCFARFSIY